MLIEHPILDVLEEEQKNALLQSRYSHIASFKEGDTVIRAGFPLKEAGLVISGCVHIYRADYDGKPLLVGIAEKGDIFAEVYALLFTAESPVTVTAQESSEILFIDVAGISNKPEFSLLSSALMRMMAKKNIMLSRKIDILSKRTIRERLLVYFTEAFPGLKSFTIPLSREELSSYIAADRSAVSAELSRMQKDGLIAVKGRNITLL